VKGRVLELCSGTASFSRVARKKGYETFTVDNDPQFEPDLCIDVLELSTLDILTQFGKPNVIWASPPCQCFTVATIGMNWEMGNDYTIPLTESAWVSIKLVRKVLQLITELESTYYIIENPRAMLRKMPFMEQLPRKTVTYCQYGERYQKPTDLWSNVRWVAHPPCAPGSSCHEEAPRGTRKGIQGLKSSKERAIVPPALCEEILEAIEQKSDPLGVVGKQQLLEVA